MKQVHPVSNTFLDLPDDLFMLALCIREENLKDPARWCKEMREHVRAMKVGPKTVAEAEVMMANAERLAIEAAGESQAMESSDANPN